MQDSSAKSGVLFAIGAYTMWGIAPLYFKLIQSIPPLEILMHRVIWSVLLLFVLVVVFKQRTNVQTAIRKPKVMLTLLASGLLLGCNWLIFIWAVNNDHMLDASLGYYINPLLNMLLGYMVLGERLKKLQLVAVAMAFIGVAYLVVSMGHLPWVALLLAGTFGIYGLMRKQVSVDSLPGLSLETLMMAPIALVYWLFIVDTPTSTLSNNSLEINLLLFSAGVVTTAPLLCFTAAAKRLRYSTLGFFQYIGPSLMFLLAVFLFNEPMPTSRLICFAFVWSGLAIFSFDSLKQYRANKASIAMAAK